MGRGDSNSQPLAPQLDAQPTELPRCSAVGENAQRHAGAAKIALGINALGPTDLLLIQREQGRKALTILKHERLSQRADRPELVLV